MPVAQSLLDAAKGALMGAMLGDAIGAHVEEKTEVTQEDLTKAFELGAFEGHYKDKYGPG